MKNHSWPRYTSKTIAQQDSNNLALRSPSFREGFFLNAVYPLSYDGFIVALVCTTGADGQGSYTPLGVMDEAIVSPAFPIMFC